MKTLKITTDNKISIVDVDFKDFRSIQQAVGGYFETVKNKKDVGLLQSSCGYAG